MVFCVNIKSKEFKDTAKRLDMSESQLEQIAHEYMNAPETQNKFPSDEYIILKTKGIPEKNPTKDQITVWNKYYSTPQVFNTREDFDKARSAALKFFSEDSIGVRNTSNGKIVMTVAKPENRVSTDEMQRVSITDRANDLKTQDLQEAQSAVYDIKARIEKTRDKKNIRAKYNEYKELSEEALRDIKHGSKRTSEGLASFISIFNSKYKKLIEGEVIEALDQSVSNKIIEYQPDGRILYNISKIPFRRKMSSINKMVQADIAGEIANLSKELNTAENTLNAVENTLITDYEAKIISSYEGDDYEKGKGDVTNLPEEMTSEEVRDILLKQYSQESSEGKLTSLVFNALKNIDIRFKASDELPSDVTGKYIASENTILYNKRGILNNTLLHEAIHAVTIYYMKANDTEGFSKEIKIAIEEIKECYQLLLEDLNLRKIPKDTYYGMTSATELVAEITNPEIVSLIKDYDEKHKGLNIFQHLIDAIAKFFGIGKKYGSLEKTLKDALATLITSPNKELMDRYALENRTIKENIKALDTTEAIVWSKSEKQFKRIEKAADEADKDGKSIIVLSRKEIEDGVVFHVPQGSYNIITKSPLGTIFRAEERTGMFSTVQPNTYYFIIDGEYSIEGDVVSLPIRFLGPQWLTSNTFNISKAENGVSYIDDVKSIYNNEAGTSVEEEAERPKTTTQQLNALLDSELSASDISAEAEKAVNWLSSAITDFMENPDKAYDRLMIPNGAEESGRASFAEEVKKMTRRQFVERVGIDNIINVYKEDVLTMGESEESQAIWNHIEYEQYDLIDLIKENLNGLIQYKASLFAKNEGFGIKLAENTGEVSEVTESSEVNPDNPDENKVKDDDGEHTGNQQDHWQIINNTLDVLYNATAKVKQALADCYVLAKSEETDEEGNVQYERVKDYLGREEKLPALDAARSIFNWTQGSVSLDDMIRKLEAKEEANPWISQILERLKDKSGKETDFQSQFFKVFDKHFQLYSVVLKNEDGKLYSKLVNVSPALDDAYNSITAQYRVSRHPMFVSTGRINKVSLDQLKKAKEALDGFEEITAENSAEAVETMGQILSLMGLPMDELSILKGLTTDNLSTIKDAVANIINKFELEKDNQNYNPFRFKDKNSISRFTKQLFKPFTAAMDEVSASAFYEDGNMYQSYVNPSYTTKLFQKFHLPENEFRQFLKNEFGASEWFVTDTSLSADELKNPDVWKLPWLQEIVKMTEEERNQAFVHKVQLLYNNGSQNKSYMRNMTAEEYTITALTEFFSDKDNKRGVTFANYRFPIMSNKKASEFVKMIRYTGDYYRDNIIDGTMMIFNQELSRIQTVEARQKIYQKGHPERIANFDDNGNHFLFLDYLDTFLHGEGKETELGKLLRAKLNGKDVDEVKLNSLVKEEVRKNYESIAEETIEKFKANGVFEYMQNIENIGESEADIEAAIRNFAWNDTFAAMNIIELLVTDLAFYKNAEDFQKRFAQVHSPGVRANAFATDYNGKRVSKDGKIRTMYIRSFNDFKSNIKANLAEVFDKKERAASEEQKLGWQALRDSVLDALDKVDVTDGQAFISITGMRKLGFMFGDWSQAAEAIYEKVKRGEANLTDLQTAFQTMKPFVYSRLSKPVNAGTGTPISTLNVPVQNKNSIYLLIMAEALLEGEETGRPNMLKALHDFMEYTHSVNEGAGVDIIQFDSTVKSGSQGVIELNDLLDVAGGDARAMNRLMHAAYTSEGSYNSTFVHEIAAEDFAQQQVVPEHFRNHEHIWGSQIRAITPSDLPTDFNGAPVTFSAVIDGETRELTPEEFRKEWDETTSKLIQLGIDELSEELGLGADVPRAERNRKISAVLQKEILSSPRYGIDLFLACSVDENGEFRIPLGDPIQSKRIEQLLNSIVKNRVNKLTVAGGPLVLATNWGTSKHLHIKFKDKVTGGTLIGYDEYIAQGHTEEEYKAYVREHQGGIEHFECLAPAWMESLYTDFADENGVIDVEALEMINPDLLKLFGYRIPTEDKYSAAPFKIVGFLPKEAGDAFMAPWEAILFTGEDFDVDKKNIQRKAINIQRKETTFKGLVDALSKVKETELISLTKEEKDSILTNHKGLFDYKRSTEKSRFDDAVDNLIERNNARVKNLEGKYAEGSEELEAAQQKLDSWYDNEYKKLEDAYNKKIEELNAKEQEYLEDVLERERQKKVGNYIRDFIESPVKFKNSAKLSGDERTVFRALKEAYMRESFEYTLPDAASREGLNNHMFDMQWSVFTHEAITDQVMNPGGFEEQKRVGYRNAAYKTGRFSMNELNRMSIDDLKKAYYTAKNLVNFNTQVQFYKQNAIAGQVLGSFAIQKVAHAMLENRHYGIAVDEGFSIAGKEYSDVVEIDKTYNDAQVERIGKTLGSLVSASADAVKDPILNLMNINTTTLKVLCAALRTGLEFDTIATLLSGRTISSMLDRYNARNLSEFVSFDTIVEERLLELQMDSGIDELSKIRGEELTYDEIISDLKDYSPNVEYKILLAYQRLSNLAKKMEPLTLMTRFNSIVSAVGPKLINNLMMEYKVNNAAESTVVKQIDGKWVEVPATQLMEDIPSLALFYSAYAQADGMFKDLNMPVASEQFAYVLASFNASTMDMILKDEKRLSNLADFFLSYVLVKSGAIDAKHCKYYIDTFPTSYISKNFKDKYPKNPFVQAIQLDTRKASNGTEKPILKIDTVGMEQEEKDKLTSGWLQFYKDEPRYAMALFYYNFFTAGIGFSPKSFMNLLPLQIKEAIPGYVDTFRHLPEVTSDICDLWIRNNVSDSKLVPYVKKDIFNTFVMENGVLTVQPEQFFDMVDREYFKTTDKGMTKVYKQTFVDEENYSIGYEEVSILGDDGRYMEFTDTPMTKTEVVKDAPMNSDVQESDIIVDTDEGKAKTTIKEERREAVKFYSTIKGETIGFSEGEPQKTKTVTEKLDEQSKKLGLKGDEEKFKEEKGKYC